MYHVHKLETWVSNSWSCRVFHLLYYWTVELNNFARHNKTIASRAHQAIKRSNDQTRKLVILWLSTATKNSLCVKKQVFPDKDVTLLNIAQSNRTSCSVVGKHSVCIKTSTLSREEHYTTQDNSYQPHKLSRRCKRLNLVRATHPSISSCPEFNHDYDIQQQQPDTKQLTIEAQSLYLLQALVSPSYSTLQCISYCQTTCFRRPFAHSTTPIQVPEKSTRSRKTRLNSIYIQSSIAPIDRSIKY